MGQELRFGIATSCHNLTIKEEIQRSRLIEELGFDNMWLGDHFVYRRGPEAPRFETWTLLSTLANHTDYIRIGTLITCFAFRNPAFLARQALTVDHISDGRLELGLGGGLSGGRDPSYLMAGIEDWSPAERVSRFREYVEIVEKCLSNRVTTYEGRYYKLKNSHMYPPPVQKPRPPITIAAHRPLMLKIAARYADSWNSVPGRWDEPLDMKLKNTHQRNKQVNEYCAKIGRDLSTLRRSLLIAEPVYDTYNSILDSTDIFQKTVKRYHELGITEFIFMYPEPENYERISMLKQIAKDVIPKIRAKLQK